MSEVEFGNFHVVPLPRTLPRLHEMRHTRGPHGGGEQEVFRSILDTDLIARHVQRGRVI